MARGSAHIDSPEVIKEFRNHWVVFDHACRQAISEMQRDVQRASEWLRREQLPHWKRELRQRREKYTVAKLEYQRLRRQEARSPQSTSIDARIAFQKAAARLEEAEAKMRAIQKWLAVLDHEAAELMGPCFALDARLDALTPRALARLDRMADSLDAYFRAAPPEAPAQE